MNYQTKFFKKTLFLILLMISTMILSAQNTIITDNDSQGADASAMLDVYSKTKGLLVPRLTQTEMENISNPAAGLLVYNTTSDNFFFFTGSEWMTVGVTEYFLENAGNLHTREDTVHIGIGTSTPLSKLTVQGDQPSGNNEALFEVKNSEGQAIFAVYENEVRVNFKEDGTKSTKGGFAVGGLRPNKAAATDYFRISPDTVQVFINDNYGVKGRKGGFAVGGLSPNGKGDRMTYLSIGPDSTRVYVNDTSFSKGRKGGFAVGGLSPNKSVSDLYFTIERDSARIFMDNSATKGRKGGFAVGGLSPNKGGGSNFMDITPENYFIGHDAGANTESGTEPVGMYNSFFGYKSGTSNTLGFQNTFMGYQSGLSNTTGENNIFIGVSAGENNQDGKNNIAIGTSAGMLNVSANNNVAIGINAGKNNNAQDNIMIGTSAGRDLDAADGIQNIYIGVSSGMLGTRTRENVCVGRSAGMYGNRFYGRNVYIGYQTGAWNNNGTENTYVGWRAGYIVAENDGDYGIRNTILGSRAGYNIVSNVNENVVLGYQSGYNLAGNRNVFIGAEAGYNETGSHKLYIENTSTGSDGALVYGEFDNDLLRFNADVGVSKSPTEKLDVNGAIRIGNTTATNEGTIRWSGSDFEGYDGSAWLSLTASGTGGTDSDWTVSSDDMYAGVSGNVGIGETSPAAKLHVKESGSSTADFQTILGKAQHGTGAGTSFIRGIKGSAQTNSWSGTNNVYGVYGEALSAATGGTGVHNTYGLYASATGSGNGTETAVGGYFTASGADNNYAAIFAQGNVGVKTNTPASGLQINTSVAKKIEKITVKNDKAGIPLDGDDNIIYTAQGIGFILPDAASCIGREYIIKSVATDPVRVEADAGAGDSIDGQPYIDLNNQWNYIKVVAAENDLWLVIAGNF